MLDFLFNRGVKRDIRSVASAMYKSHNELISSKTPQKCECFSIGLKDLLDVAEKNLGNKELMISGSLRDAYKNCLVCQKEENPVRCDTVSRFLYFAGA